MDIIGGSSIDCIEPINRDDRFYTLRRRVADDDHIALPNCSEHIVASFVTKHSQVMHRSIDDSHAVLAHRAGNDDAALARRAERECRRWVGQSTRLRDGRVVAAARALGVEVERRLLRRIACRIIRRARRNAAVAARGACESREEGDGDGSYVECELHEF
jgi:hypothetical protein